MSIETMADQKKSVMLARLMGEAVDCTCGKPGCTVGRDTDSGRGWFVPDVKNLYNPANMALAWRVLNWAGNNERMRVNVSREWFHANGLMKGEEYIGIYQMPPADVQRAWLDKILALAIEAGMVTK